MAFDEIKQAMQAFDSDIKELGFMRSMKQAQEQVQQIKSSELDEAKQRAAVQQVSSSLAQDMLKFGMPATSIQLAQQVFGPKPLMNAEQMISEGYQTGNQAEIDKGVAMARTLAIPGEEKDKRKFDYEMRRLERMKELDFQRELAVAKAKGQNAPAKPLPPKIVEKINEFDEESVLSNNILKRAEENPDFVNIAKNRFPNARSLVNSDFGAFNADVGQWFNKYKKFVTGVAGSDKEEARLLKNRPNLQTDTYELFVKKIKTIQEIGKEVRAKYIQNFGKARYDVSEFMNEQDAATEAPPRDPANDKPKWSSFIKE